MSGLRHEILILRHWQATTKAQRSRYKVQIRSCLNWFLLCMKTIYFLETIYEKCIRDHPFCVFLKYKYNVNNVSGFFDRHYIILLILSPFLPCKVIGVYALILHFIA